MDNKLKKYEPKRKRRKSTTIPQRRPKAKNLGRNMTPRQLDLKRPSIKDLRLKNFTIENTGSTEGMRDAAKIEGKPHSSPEGQFESKMRSIPLKVVTFKNGGKVRIAKRGGGRAYGRNS